VSASIREFRDDDETAVVGVWHRSGQATYTFLPSWQTFSLELAGQVFRELIRPHCQIWVAVLHEQVLGYLAMKGSYIDRMYVDPSQLRKGLGTELLDFAKCRSPEKLELHTHAQNHAARRFYEKHGFQAVKYGVSPAPESAHDVEYHWLAR
jgi:ribosomal protein S18 acetylase RimI-like enzyme